MTTESVDRPVPFRGTPDEVLANRRTHRWGGPYEDQVCSVCEAKWWHAAASYPCGTAVPREEVPLTGDAATDAGIMFPGLIAATLGAEVVDPPLDDQP